MCNFLNSWSSISSKNVSKYSKISIHCDPSCNFVIFGTIYKNTAKYHELPNSTLKESNLRYTPTKFQVSISILKVICG